MISDKCYHVPTAPGQKMCTCEDNRMFLEMLLKAQREYIDQLEHRLYGDNPITVRRMVGRKVIHETVGRRPQRPTSG